MSTALVIGANSEIAKAIIHQLCGQESITHILAVSRRKLEIDHPKILSFLIPDHTDQNIEACCRTFCLTHYPFKMVICCIGTLHNSTADIFPEKSIRHVSSEQFHHYFEINTVIPMLWLKHLATRFKKADRTKIIFLSARIGSIEDNQLGGWMGYRASKAALNMAVKTAQIELSRRYPHIMCVCYHPGTVDSPLSKPFQVNIPPEKCFTPAFTAQALLSILPTLKQTHSPHYVDWQGKSIPW